MNLPSVTQVLSVFQDFSQIPEDRLAAAAERGSTVHRICACIAEGLPYYGEIPPDCAGYVASFQQWMEYVDEVYAVEERLFDRDLGYHGQPDLVVRMRGDSAPCVPDLKTPVTVQRVWCGQMAGYKALVNKNLDALGLPRPAERVFSLRLDPKGGRAKPKEYTDDTRDLAAFMSALTAYRYFANGGG